MKFAFSSFVCLFCACGVTFSQSTYDASTSSYSLQDGATKRIGTVRDPQLEQGLEILLRLHNVLDSVQDRATADKASMQIYKLLAELTSWGQQTATKTEQESSERTEDVYLRRYKLLNDRIEAQALRLSAVEWYSSAELQRALILFVQNTR